MSARTSKYGRGTREPEVPVWGVVHLLGWQLCISGSRAQNVVRLQDEVRWRKSE
jgi:hypothetical protein